MTDRDIDEILNRATSGGQAPTERPKAQIVASLRPVRPIAPPWVWVTGFLLVFAVVAVAGAARLGLYGVAALGPVPFAIIFAVVVAAVCIAAIATVREMIPASGRRMAGAALLAAIAGLLAIFALLFHDYGMQKFVPQGVACLTAGLSFAIPAALVVCLFLRRGFVMSLTATGLAAGTLAGLAGIGVLELHCPILKAPHVMVWHVGVVVLSAAVGWGIGKFLAK
jgi:hypothetical protein